MSGENTEPNWKLRSRRYVSLKISAFIKSIWRIYKNQSNLEILLNLNFLKYQIVVSLSSLFLFIYLFYFWEEYKDCSPISI